MQLSLPLQCPVQLGVQRKHPPPPIHTSNCSVHLGVQCNPHPSNVLHDLWYNTVTLHNSGCNANPPHTHTAMPCTAWGAMQHPPPPPAKTHTCCNALYSSRRNTTLPPPPMPRTARGATHGSGCDPRLGVRPTTLGDTTCCTNPSAPALYLGCSPQPPHHLPAFEKLPSSAPSPAPRSPQRCHVLPGVPPAPLPCALQFPCV